MGTFTLIVDDVVKAEKAFDNVGSDYIRDQPVIMVKKKTGRVLSREYSELFQKQVL
jgi:hypothetical protein